MNDTTPAPSIRRRLVGSALRRYRETLGYDLGVPARILECHPSKISRIETGQRGIRPKELRELLTEYGADPAARDALTAIARRASAPGWHSDGQVPGSAYGEFLDIEKAASTIFTYAPAAVPRLLQIPDYARAVISADPDVPEDAKAALAAVELARRHAILHERRTGVTAVIGEAALRQHVGCPEVTRAQLRYLAEVSASCPEISIRILPFAAGEHAGSSAGFSILQFSQVPSLALVHVDGPAGGICLDAPAAVAAYTKTFTHLQLVSLTRQESAARLIEEALVREA